MNKKIPVYCESGCGTEIAVVDEGAKVRGMCKNCDPKKLGFITSMKDQKMNLSFHG